MTLSMQLRGGNREVAAFMQSGMEPADSEKVQPPESEILSRQRAMFEQPTSGNILSKGGVFNPTEAECPLLAGENSP